MAYEWSEGHKINVPEHIDTRFKYASFEDVFATSNPNRLRPANAVNGLPVWIEDEEVLYRIVGLVGGESTAVLRTKLVPDASIPGQIEAIIKELLKENTIEKLFTEEFLETLIDQMFSHDTVVEKLTTLLFDDDAFQEKLKDYWSKLEMRVMSQAEYDESANSIPDGTVVLIKESQ